MSPVAATGLLRHAPARWFAAAAFLAAFALYARSAAPGPAFEGSGELAAAALDLGVSSPPGQPWHSLLGRLFLLLPAGSPAFRLNMMSAACGALLVLAAWRLGAAAAGRTAAARIPLPAAAAALVLAASSAVWRQSGVAEKHALAAVLAGWALVVLVRGGGASRDRHILLAGLLAGVSAGIHFAGACIIPLLAFELWRDSSRRGRSAALVLFLLALPAGARLLYTPVRAAAHPALCDGYPDSAPGLARYLAATREVGTYVFRDHSFGGLVSGAIRQSVVLPWRQAGGLVLVALLGAWALWHRECRIVALVGGLFAADAVLGTAFQAPAPERGFLPACLALAVFAGAGVEWLAGIWRWAPAACGVLWLWSAVATAPAAMRDRETAAPDHARNMLLFVRPGDLVLGWGDPWLTPLLHERAVAGRARAAGVRSAGDLEYGSPGRRMLAASGIPGTAPLAGGAVGPALVWRMGAAAASRAAWLTPEAPPAVLPSRGVRWRGLLIRAGDLRDPSGLDDPDPRWLRGLRLHSLVDPRGPWEEAVVTGCAYALNTRAQVLLRAGRARDAETVARTGTRLAPSMPELRQTLGSVLMAQGREVEAGAEWQAAIALTRGAYLDPYLGLAGIVRAKGGATAADEELELMRTAAALAAPGRDARSPRVAEGDDLRSLGKWSAAREAYRRAVGIGMVTRGMAHFQAGRLPQAAAAWEEALEFDPGSGAAMQGLGTLAALEERFGDALRWYRAARRAGPWSRELEENVERTMEAVEWAPRLERLEARARKSPGDVSALVEAGNAEWYVGRTRAAEDFYRRALRADPGNVRALTNMGSTCAQTGRVREAIRLFERAVAADPAYTPAMVNLAAVHFGAGRRKEGEAWLRRALKADPKDRRALRMARDAGGV